MERFHYVEGEGEMRKILKGRNICLFIVIDRKELEKEKASSQWVQLLCCVFWTTSVVFRCRLAIHAVLTGDIFGPGDKGDKGDR